MRAKSTASSPCSRMKCVTVIRRSAEVQADQPQRHTGLHRRAVETAAPAGQGLARALWRQGEPEISVGGLMDTKSRPLPAPPRRAGTCAPPGCPRARAAIGPAAGHGTTGPCPRSRTGTPSAHLASTMHDEVPVAGVRIDHQHALARRAGRQIRHASRATAAGIAARALPLNCTGCGGAKSQPGARRSFQVQWLVRSPPCRRMARCPMSVRYCAPSK